jgi:pyruvate formate lyase activating enzyme
MKRRTFMTCLGCGTAATIATQTGLFPPVINSLQNAFALGEPSELSSVEARHYKKLPGGGIECGICPRHCQVTDLERGYCGSRENQGDVYRTLVYGKPCSLNIDPIEKKPFFHFHPGTLALSLATAGCNVNCKFCQNWEISQSRPEQTENMDLLPQAVVDLAMQRKTPNIAYTYSEPTIFYEYMYDIAEGGHKQGIRSVMVTGGYIEQEPLRLLIPHLDAIKVDLKSIREDYYKTVVNGELKPVLDRLVQMKKSGIWLEIVTLVVPTLNDTDAEFRDLANWVKVNLGADVPLHFSQFYPQYLLKNLPPTPQATLEKAHAIARSEGMQYVYLGNLPGHPAESTYCPKCSAILVERNGYRITQMNLVGSRCPKCQQEIPGRF